MSHHCFSQMLGVTPCARAALKDQRPCVVWLTGLSGAGKSTIADALECELYARGIHTFLLDGDNVRGGLCKDLGFSKEAREENIRRIAEVAKLFVDAGIVVIAAFISPFKADRAMAREIIGNSFFYEVYVDTSLHECERRDPKGLYKKARAGLISNFTGIDSVYEPPENPDIYVDTTREALGDTVSRIINYLGASK